MSLPWLASRRLLFIGETDPCRHLSLPQARKLAGIFTAWHANWSSPAADRSVAVHQSVQARLTDVRYRIDSGFENGDGRLSQNWSAGSQTVSTRCRRWPERSKRRRRSSRKHHSARDDSVASGPTTARKSVRRDDSTSEADRLSPLSTRTNSGPRRTTVREQDVTDPTAASPSGARTTPGRRRSRIGVTAT